VKVLYVTHEQLLESPKQVCLLGLSYNIDELKLKRDFLYLVELDQHRFNSELKDGQIHILSNLGHCIKLVVHCRVSVEYCVLQVE